MFIKVNRNERSNLLFANEYLCRINLILVIILGILLVIVLKKVRQITIMFFVFYILNEFLFRKTNKVLSYEDLSNLIKNKNFKEMELSVKHIPLLSAKLSYDGFIKAPFDVLKNQSKLIKFFAIVGIVLSPFTVPLGFLYSLFELYLLYLISRKKNLLILFSKEIYYRLTREVSVFKKESEKEIFFKIRWYGIPGIILIPKEYCKELGYCREVE